MATLKRFYLLKKNHYLITFSKLKSQFVQDLSDLVVVYFGKRLNL